MEEDIEEVTAPEESFSVKELDATSKKQKLILRSEPNSRAKNMRLRWNIGLYELVK